MQIEGHNLARLTGIQIKKLFKTLTIVLSSLAVFMVFYVLILPALTLEHPGITLTYESKDDTSFTTTLEAQARAENDETYFVLLYDPDIIEIQKEEEGEQDSTEETTLTEVKTTEEDENKIQFADENLSYITLVQEVVEDTESVEEETETQTEETTIQETDNEETTTDTEGQTDTITIYWFTLKKENQTKFSIPWTILSNEDTTISYGYGANLQEAIESAKAQEEPLTIPHAEEQDTETVDDTTETVEEQAEEEEESEFTLDSDITVTNLNDGIMLLSDEGTDSGETVETQSSTEIDLAPYMQKVTVSKWVNNDWVESTEFTEGDLVYVEMNYTLNQGILSADNHVAYYQLPSGIKPNKEESGVVYQDSNSVGTYTIDTNGRITVNFDESFAQMTPSFTGKITFVGQVSLAEGESSGSLSFGGDTNSITIKKEESSSATDVQVSKTHEENKETGEVTYTVTVTTTKGTEALISIEDSLKLEYSSGTPTYEKDSFAIKKYTTSNNSDWTEDTTFTGAYLEFGNNDTSFIYDDLSGLSTNEKYVVTYKVKADYNDKGERYVVNSASSNGHSSTWTYSKVSDSLIEKWSSYDSATQKVKYTVTINKARTSIENWTLTDSVWANDSTYLTPSDFTLQDVTDGYKAVEFTGFPYTFTNTNHTYQLTYYVDVRALSENNSTVKNTATFTDPDDKEYKAETTTNVSKRTNYSVNKWSEGSTEETVVDRIFKWNSTVTIPNGTLTSFTYTDTIGDLTDTSGDALPESNSGHYGIASELDSELKSNLKLYYYAYDSDNKISGTSQTLICNNELVDFTFHYYDANGTEVSADNTSTPVKSFTITVTPKSGTKIEGYQLSAGTYQTHADFSGIVGGETWQVTNTGAVGAIASEAIASYTKSKVISKLVKNSSNEYVEGNASVDVDFDGYLYYEVLVDMSSLPSNEDIIITDTLPDGMSYVERSVKGYFYGNQWWMSESNGNYNFNSDNHITVTPGKTEDGKSTIKFTIAQGFKEAGSGFSYICLRYTTSVTGDTAWQSLADTTKTYTNTVTWEDNKAEQSTEVHKESEAIMKTATQLTDDSGNNTNQIQYTVVINPSAQDLYPLGDTLTLTDTLSWTSSSVYGANLDLDNTKLYYYSGDQKNPVATENGVGKEVDSKRYGITFDELNHIMTVTVPDNLACVLVYTYTFDIAASQTPTISNEVSLNGNQWSTTDTTPVEASDSSASVQTGYVTINKVDAGNYKKKLQGAQFLIQYWDTSSNQWLPLTLNPEKLASEESDGAVNNGEGYYTLTNGTITFTSASTSAEGKVKTNIVYKITEIEPPKNYTKDESPKYIVMMEGNASVASTKQKMQDQFTAIKAAGDTLYESTNGDQEQNVYFFDVTENNNLYIENENQSITVNKVWIDNDGKDLTSHPGSVEVQLVQSTAKYDGYTVTVTSSGINYYPVGTINEAFGPSVQVQTDIVEKNSKLVLKTNRLNYGGSMIAISINGGEYQYFTENKTDKVNSWDSSYWMYIIDSVDEDLNIDIRYMEAGDASSWITIEYGEYTFPTAVNVTSKVNKGQPITLNSDNNWTYTWSSLDKKDSNGNPYYYSVVETYVDGYETTYSASNIEKGEITITNKLATYSLPATGGKGSTMITTGGWSLIILSILLYLYKLRKDQNCKKTNNLKEGNCNEDQN